MNEHSGESQKEKVISKEIGE